MYGAVPLLYRQSGESFLTDHFSDQPCTFCRRLKLIVDRAPEPINAPSFDCGRKHHARNLPSEVSAEFRRIASYKVGSHTRKITVIRSRVTIAIDTYVRLGGGLIRLFVREEVHLVKDQYSWHM